MSLDWVSSGLDSIRQYKKGLNLSGGKCLCSIYSCKARRSSTICHTDKADVEKLYSRYADDNTYLLLETNWLQY